MGCHSGHLFDQITESLRDCVPGVIEYFLGSYVAHGRRCAISQGRIDVPQDVLSKLYSWYSNRRRLCAKDQAPLSTVLRLEHLVFYSSGGDERYPMSSASPRLALVCWDKGLHIARWWVYKYARSSTRLRPGLHCVLEIGNLVLQYLTVVADE